MLFSKLSKEGVTTFYDSVCGLPLFKAPFGRTLQEFQQDTQAHGWPSFRPEEVGRPSPSGYGAGHAVRAGITHPCACFS